MAKVAICTPTYDGVTAFYCWAVVETVTAQAARGIDYRLA